MKRGSRFAFARLPWKTAILLMLPLFLVPILPSWSVPQRTSPAWAQEQKPGEHAEFLYGFLEGSYTVIGRSPDSNKTYAGKVVLRKRGEGLQVIREINGREIRGTGKIATATADSVAVLKVGFFDGGKDYEATYLIQSDLDNYARLTGYVYLKKGGTTRPGLEALFISNQ